MSQSDSFCGPNKRKPLRANYSNILINKMPLLNTTHNQGC